MTPLLEARSLTRRYGTHTAVRDLSFSLEQGQVLGFLGPNGAGKSTCLRMLTGVLVPSAGSVSIQGIDLWREPVRAKALLGYLPEQPPLYPDMRVDEYLDHCGRLRRIPRRSLAAAVTRAKGRCGLEAVGRRLIRKLSKGYRQRLGLAQAILHEPALIVLDEPTVGLDPGQVREVRELVRELGRERGLLLSSHLLAEVQAVCSRVLILNEGRLVHEECLAGPGSEPAAGDLLVRLERPPPAQALAALPGVGGVTPLAGGRFRVAPVPGAATAAIAERLVQAGWGLQELTPERRGLEQTFLALTAGEPPA